MYYSLSDQYFLECPVIVEIQLMHRDGWIFVPAPIKIFKVLPNPIPNQN